MFTAGDKVSYGSTGVCIVGGEMQQKVKGEIKKYLVLKPVFKDNSTVYVPVDNEKLMSRLKPVMTSGEAENVISAMSDTDEVWISNDSERTQTFRSILSGGDMMKVARMVRILYLHRKNQYSRGRKLHASDEHFFKDAEELLFDELANALGMKPEEISGYLAKKLP